MHMMLRSVSLADVMQPIHTRAASQAAPAGHPEQALCCKHGMYVRTVGQQVSDSSAPPCLTSTASTLRFGSLLVTWP